MLICPMCKKTVPESAGECPRCRADLTILVDYVSHLQDGLERARALTRQGELGEAVWAYLQVLEVDPDNALARQQVGQVVTAVRQFDRAAPGRRWLQRLQRQTLLRRLLAFWQEEASTWNWPAVVIVVSLMFLAALAGFGLGRLAGPQPPPAETPSATTTQH
jgi:Tetratricopeptide repeat